MLLSPSEFRWIELVNFSFRPQACASWTPYREDNVDAGFGTQLEKHLPHMDLGRRETAAFRARCKKLVDASVRGVVTRKDIEAALVDCAPSVANDWRSTPTELQLTASAFDLGPLSLDVSAFNSPHRGTLAQTAWEQLQQHLREIGDFLHASRSRRGVRLSAKHRMSLACLLGHSFSATRNFTLLLEHNDYLFDTSIHDKAAGPFFSARQDPRPTLGLEGFASISFPNGTNDDVAANALAFNLENSPMLSLMSTSVVSDIASLNTAVHEAKLALVDFRARFQLKQVHLFIKAPAIFAAALGHRLNGVGCIQLYDWAEGKYVPTLQLS
jgi:hypothetical protein